MKNSVCLSIVLPVYNEESIIQQTLEESARWLQSCEGIDAYELIAVNDGSEDKTGDVLDGLKSSIDHLVVVNYEQNKGYGGALISGIQEAQYDWVLLMDSDGQFKIDAIGEFLPFTNDFDIVAGYRAQRKDNIFRVWLGEFYTTLARTFLRVGLRDINCGFKLFNKSYLLIEGMHTHAGAFYTHVFIKAQARQARIKELAVVHHPRRGGRPTGASIKVVLMAIGDFFSLLFHKGGRKS